MFTAAPVRLTTMMLRTGAFSQAASTLALSGILRPPRMPSSAVTITSDLQSLTRPDRVRREAAEDHRVDRADARAGEDGVGGLEDHRQVDGDAVALLDA